MTDLSSSKIISHWFKVDTGEGKSGIGYDILIFLELMVHLFLKDDIK